MAGHDMAAQLIPDLERAFEVDLLTNTPAPDIGLVEGFRADLDLEPVRTQLNHGQADPGTGDGGPDVDAPGVVAGADPRPQVAAAFEIADVSYVGHDAGKHDFALVAVARTTSCGKALPQRLRL